jgi:ABC-2 type transport system permease protein
MWKDAFFIARMDAWHLLRRRETMLWTFIMPVIFIYFIGTITGNVGGSGDSKDDLAVRIPADGGFLADQLIVRLESLQYRVVRTKSQEELNSYRRRLEIPAGFTDAVLAGYQMKLRFARTGDDLTADYDRVRISRAVYTVLADMILATKDGAAATPEALAKITAEPRTLTLDVKPAGKRVDPPSGFEQSVPGTMVMFTLLVLFTSGAVSLTVERKLGILRRLASAPMARGAVTLGKWGARMALGMVQIIFAMTAGTVLFHVHWGPNLPMALVILLAYGALAAALGMLLGNYGRTEAQVIGIGVIASNLLAGLGGCMWPIEIAPRWAQHLALFLPTGWTMDALHKLVNFQASAASVIPHLVATLIAALLAGYAVSRSFRFE